jgi:hypothetical protein
VVEGCPAAGESAQGEERAVEAFHQTARSGNSRDYSNFKRKRMDSWRGISAVSLSWRIRTSGKD